MKQKPVSRLISRLFSIILLMSLLFSNLSVYTVLRVQAQSVETNPSSHKTSAASNEVPLYPGLTWAQAENEQLTVSTGFGSDSVELPGSSYLSESIRGKPEHDLRYFYSVEALANSEWYLVDEGLGVGAEKTVYYKEPNQYLVVQFGKCDGGNSLEYRCFKVWISSPDANPPAPILLNVSSSLSPSDATVASASFQNPLPVPVFSQNDSSWKNDRLGFPDSGYPTACDFCTVGGYGCFTTSYTMLYNYYQSNYTTPKNLNTNLITGGTRYVNNGAHCNNLMPGGSPYAPSGVSRGNTYLNDCTQSNCIDSVNIPRVQNEINAGRPLMAYVHYSPGGYKQHMVVITGYSGSTYYINDPWDGGRRTLATGALGAYVVDEIRQWNGTPPGGGNSLNPPTLLSPGQGQTLTSRSVHFTWQSPNATNQNGYTFRLSTSSNPDTQPWLRDTGLGNEYTGYDFNFSADSTFYWHMRTWNTSGQSSSWVTRSFVINTSGGGGNHPPAGFTWCADEEGRCSFSGTADVVYGALDSFTSPRSFTNGVDCNNGIFGDPISGTRKACYYKASSPPSGNLHVEYFNDKNLGSRCYDGYENSTYVFKNWGSGSPANGCNSDNFSARFTGTYSFSGGSYSFHCQHDDGCRIFIDGQEKLNAWWDSSFTGHDWGGTLSGNHEVKIEFYDSGGDARLETFWSGAGFLPTGPGCTPGEWCAQYYGNKDLSGTPAVNRNEGNTNIDHSWNDGGIGYGFPNDNFSVRWQRNVYFAAGRYRFHTRTDDGARLWVNNNLVIDQWRDQGATEYTFDLDLAAGAIPLKFEYYDGGGGAVAQMWWDALQLYVDNATFVTQSPYPTVNPGANLQIYFEVKNTGTTTWQTNTYWLENLQNPLGASARQSLPQAVSPNGTYRWTINVTAPTTPGMYRSQWMISHNGSVFGPNMFIDVTVAGNPDLTPYPREGRQDPLILSPTGGTSVNGTLHAGQPIYIDWGFSNIGNADINANYYVDLYIDNQRLIHYPYTWLCTGCIGGFDDWQETWDTPGWHTVKLVVDPDNTVAESNEGNNTWAKDFYWVPTNLTLSVNKTGTGSGTVTSNPAGINCGSDCSETYSNNATVTLTASPAAGSTFAGWSGGGCSGTGTCTVTITGAVIVTANFVGNSPGAFSKSSPANGATNQPTSLTLIWAPSAGATSYAYCYDTTNDNACSNWTANGISTSKALTGLSSNITYYWHVRAFNSFGVTYANGATTAFWSFRTGSGGPGDFSKSSPANGAINQPTGLTLAWAPSSGAGTYAYCYDTTNDNACSNWTSNGAATSKALTGLSLNTTYYWHVRAFNSLGARYSNGSTTAFWSFSTGSGAPGAFSKSSPANAATNQPLSLTLTWQASPGATFYAYCYDTTNDNTCSGWTAIGNTTSKSLTGLSPYTTYYWHIRAFNALSSTFSNGSSTAYWSFSTGNGAPGAFSKNSPANGVTNQPLSLTLTWQASPGATFYAYCYDTTNDNSCSNWTAIGNTTSKVLSGLSPNTTYYWHIRAFNSYSATFSNGAATSFWSFRTSG